MAPASRSTPVKPGSQACASTRPTPTDSRHGGPPQWSPAPEWPVQSQEPAVLTKTQVPGPVPQIQVPGPLLGNPGSRTTLRTWAQGGSQWTPSTRLAHLLTTALDLPTCGLQQSLDTTGPQTPPAGPPRISGGADWWRTFPSKGACRA